MNARDPSIPIEVFDKSLLVACKSEDYTVS